VKKLELELRNPVEVSSTSHNAMWSNSKCHLINNKSITIILFRTVVFQGFCDSHDTVLIIHVFPEVLGQRDRDGNPHYQALMAGIKVGK